MSLKYFDYIQYLFKEFKGEGAIKGINKSASWGMVEVWEYIHALVDWSHII